MNEYVGCTYESVQGGLLLHQPRLIKRVEEKFGSKINHLQTYDVPLPAGYTTVNPLPDEACLNSRGQQEYQSGVGMALYLVKHSRPDLANATHEL